MTLDTPPSVWMTGYKYYKLNNFNNKNPNFVTLNI